METKKVVYTVALDNKVLSTSKVASDIKLADFLEALFVPTSANAVMYNGLDRQEVAKVIESNFAKLGNFKVVSLTCETGKITVKKENILNMVKGVIFAVTENKAFRIKVDKTDESFKLARDFEVIGEKKTDNRGRKSSGNKYALDL